MQQELGQSSHSSAFLLPEGPSRSARWLHPRPSCSLFVVLNTLSHLLLYGTALWFSFHHSFCLPVPYSAPFPVPIHSKSSQGLCSDLSSLLPSQQEIRFIPRFWARNCTGLSWGAVWDARHGGKCWCQSVVVQNVNKLGWPLGMAPVGSALWTHSACHPFSINKCQLGAFVHVLSVIQAAWAITQSNLEGWMNEKAC